MALVAMLPMIMVPLHRAECLTCGGAEVGEHRMNNVGQPQAGPLAGRLEWTEHLKPNLRPRSC